MVVQTLVEKKSVALFPLPKFIDDEVIERIKRKISLTRTCVLSEDASVSLSEGAKLQIDSLVKNVEGNMSLHIKDISKFIERQYNKKYGSVEKINEKLGEIREAKGILLSEGSSVDSFKNFAAKINLAPAIIQAMTECYEKLDFCKTLSREVQLNATINEKLITKLSELEHIMQSELKNIAKEEEI